MKNYLLLLIAVLICIITNQASAAPAPIPGIDAGRIGLDQKQELPEPPDATAPAPEVHLPGIQPPTGAENITFVLQTINFEGITAFDVNELSPLYTEYLGKTVSLSVIWQIANGVTKHYTDKGYFLSRAFVPEQEINEGGSFTIKVIEGYVGAVEIDDPIAENYIVEELINTIKSKKPLNIKDMESFTLRLNDIHGFILRSVIEQLKDENSDDAAVKVILIKQKEKISGSISVDNYNSMFSGPYQATLNLEGSIMPQHKTSVTLLNSMPVDKLKSISGNHNFVISPTLSVDIYGGYTDSHPGYTLKSNDIESDSSNIGVSLNYQPIRQRQENLILRLKLDSKDVATNVLETALTRDHIRVARISASYDRGDPLGGYNFVTSTFSQGLTIFSASEENDPNLSRIGVDPEFNKLELSWNRFQNFGNWTAVTSTSMQLSSGPQYSSEQIGYGGQSYGRAYDPSDIVGDEGILGSIELGYQNLPLWNNISFVPYGFYDIGQVWSSNDDSAVRSSAGLGVRIKSESGIFANFTIAQPLIHEVATPPYGNGKNLRVFGQVGFRF